MFRKQIAPTWNGLDEHLAIPVKLLTALGALFLVWRVWRFTILPMFQVNEPKELPYWVPFLGHAKAFFMDSEALLSYGRTYFGNTREIFALTVAGQKMYIVLLPKDISMVFRNPETLTFEGFVKDMYKSFGMSTSGIAKMFHPVPSKNERNVDHDISKQQHAHLGTGIQREQLHPGSNLDGMLAVYLSHIKQQMESDKIPMSCTARKSPGSKLVSLRKWCTAVTGPATVEALFGSVLLELDLNFLDDFNSFDSDSWMLLYQYPRIFAKPMYQAIDRGTVAFTRYFELPAEKRPHACHYIKAVEAKQRAAAMSDRDIAIAAQGFFWAANANPPKITAWLIAHVLYDPALLEAIRKEIAPAVSSHDIDMQYLVDQCPKLNASLDETLRLVTGAASARNVDEVTKVGHMTLAAKAKILIPYRQLHYDEEFFGPDTSSFKPSRFLDNKDLHKSPYFKPFGGGVTFCSGRFLARRQVLALAAVILTRYELDVVDREKGMPGCDMKKPTLGVMDPIGGEDVLLEVRLRA